MNENQQFTLHEAMLLAVLANHLERGELNPPVFDIKYYIDKDTLPFSCNTAGCAIGNLPTLFPKVWAFSKIGNQPVFIKSIDCLDTEYSIANLTTNQARSFFQLTDFEFGHLFVVESQDTRTFGGIDLEEDCTQFEVAQNILEFLELKGFERKDLEPNIPAFKISFDMMLMSKGNPYV